VISGEQQYIVLNTASPSTKSPDKLKIWGELLATLMDQCSQVGANKKIEEGLQVCKPKRRASAAGNQTGKPKRQNKFNSQ